MQIKIDAPGHKNQNKLRSFLQEKIQSSFSKYNFINSVTTRVTEDHGLKVISLQLVPKNGSLLFVKDMSKDENEAVNSVMRKMQSQVKKYKDMRFGKARRV